jgi:hypothetical protein
MNIPDRFDELETISPLQNHEISFAAGFGSPAPNAREGIAVATSKEKGYTAPRVEQFGRGKAFL